MPANIYSEISLAVLVVSFFFRAHYNFLKGSVFFKVLNIHTLTDFFKFLRHLYLFFYTTLFQSDSHLGECSAETKCSNLCSST